MSPDQSRWQPGFQWVSYRQHRRRRGPCLGEWCEMRCRAMRLEAFWYMWRAVRIVGERGV